MHGAGTVGSFTYLPSIRLVGLICHAWWGEGGEGGGTPEAPASRRHVFGARVYASLFATQLVSDCIILLSHCGRMPRLMTVACAKETAPGMRNTPHMPHPDSRALHRAPL